MIAFSVTCKHLHRHCIRLFSFSYTSVFTAFTFHSDPLTSIGTPHIDIITSIDHHFLRSLLLSPPLPLNMPVRGLYGHGKGSYGHGLAHTLPIPALCGHGKGDYFMAVILFTGEESNSTVCKSSARVPTKSSPTAVWMAMRSVVLLAFIN